LEVSLKTGVRVRDFESSTRKQVMSDRGKYKRAAKNDVTYNMMRMWQGAVGVSPVDGLVSPAYVVARPYPQVEPRFFVALFRTGDYMSEIDSCSHGIVKDRNRLYWDQFKQILSPCPPPAEQAAIVRFLDWANGRLDRAIRAKRKVIALLNEQKQAIIHRAVTCGLDPSVPLKPSGIPWLGDIPQHWEVRKIGAVSSRVTKGTTPTTLGMAFVDAGVRFLKVESISKDLTILPSKCAYIDESTDRLLSRSRLRGGDVVVAIAGAIGRPAVIAEWLLPANTNQAVAIISPRTDQCRSEWLAYILSSPVCQRTMADSSVQSAQANLSLANLGRTLIPLPTIDEQGAILSRLKAEVHSIDSAIARLEREIELLREYRTRLVADVVTGKLDVREAAARLPDEAPPDTAEEETDLSDETQAYKEEAAV
jgi:type I restriction enzyme S subunit